MRIAKYISDLLFEYECVVIPGLGGFISSEVPAGINTVQHTFSPPRKNIVFNGRLQTNDGLLINHIASSEDIGYATAKARLERFVRKCHKALDEGKRIHFHKIGIIFKNRDGDIIFEADTAYNYMADSYGLSSFISPAIRRETVFRTEQKFKDRKPHPEKQGKTRQSKTAIVQEKKPKYITINVFGLILTIGLILLFVFNFGTVKQLYHNYGNLVPFFYNTPNEYVILNFGNELPDDIKGDKKSVAGHFDQSMLLTGDDMTTYQEKQDELTKTDQFTYDPSLDKETAADEQMPTETDESYMEEEINEEDYPVATPKTKTELEETPPPAKTYSPGIPNPDPNVYNIENFTKPNFILVGGSFETEAAARELAKSIPEAFILNDTSSQKFRVCYARYTNLHIAGQELATIRKQNNPDAWVLLLNQ